MILEVWGSLVRWVRWKYKLSGGIKIISVGVNVSSHYKYLCQDVCSVLRSAQKPTGMLISDNFAESVTMRYITCKWRFEFYVPNSPSKTSLRQLNEKLWPLWLDTPRRPLPFVRSHCLRQLVLRSVSMSWVTAVLFICMNMYIHFPL